MSRHDAEAVRRAITALEETGLDQVNWTAEDGRRYELRIVEGGPEAPAPREAASEIPGLARAQAFLRGLVPEGRNVVDELIAERREEARKEEL